MPVHPIRSLALALDPAQMMTTLGLEPDPWQARLLRSTARRILLLSFRQSGKSTATACLALHTATFRPGSLVVLVSPSERQSGELFRKVCDDHQALALALVTTTRQTATELELSNGSRIVSLPGNDRTIRGYSGARLMIIDEAALTEDALYIAVRPMVTASRGRLLALSTPFGQRGWFHAAWSAPDPEDDWERIRVTAADSRRTDPADLAAERRAMGERMFNQEYMCTFESTLDQLFSPEDIEAAFRDDDAKDLATGDDEGEGDDDLLFPRGEFPWTT